MRSQSGKIIQSTCWISSVVTSCNWRYYGYKTIIWYNRCQYQYKRVFKRHADKKSPAAEEKQRRLHANVRANQPHLVKRPTPLKNLWRKPPQLLHNRLNRVNHIQKPKNNLKEFRRKIWRFRLRTAKTKTAKSAASPKSKKADSP